jgi:hypothetical protein
VLNDLRHPGFLVLNSVLISPEKKYLEYCGSSRSVSVRPSTESTSRIRSAGIVFRVGAVEVVEVVVASRSRRRTQH